MLHRRINDAGDHWSVSATSAYPGVQAPVVLVQLQENGEQVRVAMTAEQAEDMALELLRRVAEVRTGEVVMGDPCILPTPPVPSEAVLAAKERGATLLNEWTTDGTLISLESLAKIWEVALEKLENLAAADALFYLTLNKTRYVPAAWAFLKPQQVMAVCEPQEDLTPTARIVFWKRAHNSLKNRTPLEAIDAGDLESVIRLAKTWSV